MNVEDVHDRRNFLGQIFKHFHRLLKSAELPGAHGQPPSDVDHDVGVPAMLGLHHGVLVLHLLRPPVVLLGYSIGFPELALGLVDVGRLLLGQEDVTGGAFAVLGDRLLSRLNPGLRVSLPPRGLHQFVLGFAGVRLAGEEGLMVLGREIHVVVGQRLLFSRALKPLIFGASKQIQRIAPNFALGHRIRRRTRAPGDPVFVGVAAAQPGADVVQGDLFDEALAVPAVVPPLEDEDEAGDEGGGAGEGHVELGRQRGEKHGGHAEVFADFEGPAQVIQNEDDLKEQVTDSQHFHKYGQV